MPRMPICPALKRPARTYLLSATTTALTDSVGPQPPLLVIAPAPAVTRVTRVAVLTTARRRRGAILRRDWDTGMFSVLLAAKTVKLNLEDHTAGDATKALTAGVHLVALPASV